MQYNGGKAAVAKDIAKIISECAYGETYWEPFVGAGNVICRPELAHLTRFGSDADTHIIQLLNAVKAGWLPPTEVSEVDYVKAKLEGPSALRAFVGYGCSFGGKFFGGYARSGGRNYAANAANSLNKQRNALQDLELVCADYTKEPFGHVDII